MNATKQHQMRSSDIGIVIDRSHDNADSINLETIELAQQYGFECELPDENDEDYGQILSETGDDAVSFLNDNVEHLPYCSFYFEDNSLFYTPSIEMAEEDVEFKSSRKNEYPPEDYEGEWLHVNDHGNCTLYVRSNGQDTEIWSIV